MDRYEIPANLSLLSDEDCERIQAEVRAEVERVVALDATPELTAYAIDLERQFGIISAEVAGRTVRAEQRAQAEQQALTDQRDLIAARIRGEEPPAPAEVELQASGVDYEQLVRAAAEGASQVIVAAMGDKRSRTNLEVRDRLPSLAAAADLQPRGSAPSGSNAASVVASIGIPGFSPGSDLASIRDVGEAFEATARSMYATGDGVGRPTKVVTIKRDFDITFDERTRVGDLMEYVQQLNRPQNHDALVAGGGWCAPSLPIYSFFNIACADGLVDLPTVGVARGGLQIPTSPSLADATYTIGGSAGQGFPTFAGAAAVDQTTMPFLWTETTDIATVTGTPNKPTMRVPCPTYTNTRLEVYGIQLTAGNLTNDAFPEATQNTIRLLNAAWAHAQNARIISQMVALSTAAITISGGANRPAYNQIISGLDLAATDYRAKFGMCETDVLECVAPFWLKDVIIADLAWRTKVDLIDVTEDQINGYLRNKQIRVQWVNDWQVRGSGQFGQAGANLTAWPTSGQVMLYAAGTFLKGNGLTLDLGVVRDSVLNAENDYTAVFSEEAHLVAKVGHESRLYTIGFVVNGSDAGAQSLGAFI